MTFEEYYKQEFLWDRKDLLGLRIEIATPEEMIKRFGLSENKTKKVIKRFFDENGINCWHNKVKQHECFGVYLHNTDDLNWEEMLKSVEEEVDKIMLEKDLDGFKYWSKNVEYIFGIPGEENHTQFIINVAWDRLGGWDSKRGTKWQVHTVKEIIKMLVDESVEMYVWYYNEDREEFDGDKECYYNEELADLYKTLCVEEGEPVYLNDGVYLYPNGSMEEI